MTAVHRPLGRRLTRLAAACVAACVLHPSWAQSDPVAPLLQQGRYAEALEEADRLLGQSADDPTLLFFRSIARAETGDLDGAISDMQTLNTRFPGQPEYLNNLGVLQMRKGELADAQGAFEAALAAQPDYAMAHENLADVHVRRALVHLQAASSDTSRREALADRIALLQPLAPNLNRDAAERATPVPAEAPLTAEINAALETWRSAWEQARIEDYLAAYGLSFAPESGSRASWETTRRQRLASHSNMQITLEEVSVQRLGPLVQAEFVQRFQSNRLRDVSRKQIVFEEVGDRWMIIREAATPVR